MHPVARVLINIYRNLRTQQISVLVLLCTSYATCFGNHLQVVCNTEIRALPLITETLTIPHLLSQQRLIILSLWGASCCVTYVHYTNI
jgi:hypothetical protein